jgi:hypothetical protein
MVVELRAWIGILIYMGIKKQPARRHYWSRCELLRCKVIPTVISCRMWESIQRCLHLVDNTRVVRDCKLHGYDKIAKMRWLVDAFRQRACKLYNPYSMLTVDEMIVPYKGRYCKIQ